MALQGQHYLIEGFSDRVAPQQAPLYQERRKRGSEMRGEHRLAGYAVE
jgi:hypothetical protein